MISYRLLERYTSKDNWVPFGVAYQEKAGEQVRLFVVTWKSPKPLHIYSLWDLDEEHFPQLDTDHFSNHLKFEWSVDTWQWNEEVEPFLPLKAMHRVLQFFWLIDYSGSMHGEKITALNQAIHKTLPAIRKAAAQHPDVRVMMRAIKFANDASWHVGPQAVPLDRFEWPALDADGDTATAKALALLVKTLQEEKTSRRYCPPVCILISDGYYTDPQAEYDGAINALLDLPKGKQSVRLAIALGDESDYDADELLKFVSHKEVGVLIVHDPRELEPRIKWASERALKQAVGSEGEGNEPPITPLGPSPTPSPATAPEEDVR